MLNSEKIKELMKEKGIRNYLELAHKIKMSTSTLYHLLGGYDSNVSSIMRIASFFGVTIDEIIHKNYSIVTVTKDGIIRSNSSNIYEVTLKNSIF